MHHKRVENRLDQRINLRGGHGTIDMYHLFEESEMLGKAKMCTRLVVHPQCSIGSHPHNPEAEIYYVISGTLEMDDNGQTMIMEAGDIMFTGQGESHGLRNPSDHDAEVFTIILT